MFEKPKKFLTSPAGLTLAGGLLMLVIIGFFFNRQSNYKITNWPNNNSGVVMFGDSLVAGVGATEGNTLPAQLADRLGTVVVNLGVSGNTTADGLARIDQLPQNHRLVIIVLGGNDVLKKVPDAQVYQNLRNIIDDIQKRGSMVALAGVKSSLLGEGELTQQYKIIAEETGSIFLGSVLDDVFGNRDLMSDRIHPNDAGYAVIADRMAKQLRPYLVK